MNNLFRYFSIISKHSTVFLDKALESFELCGCHRVFIKRIVENPGITRDKIKQIAHVHPSNTTRTIDYMESLGYVIKKVSVQDKRICELYPTDKLKEAYKNKQIQLLEEHEKILNELNKIKATKDATFQAIKK